MKNILITGANSYIGKSLEKWLSKRQSEYSINTIDILDDSWKSMSFSNYDIIFHVAGVAHIKETKQNASLYYKVNRDLTAEIAKKAKNDKVKQFIFLSTMSVYGIETGIITRDTVPEPKSNYGKSKLEAEENLRKLESDNFKIAILRPPMVYGSGCKGNYNALSKLAKRISIFPNIDNKRSMIYIDNLCECVRIIIDNNLNGIFFPQNDSYVNTSEMVKIISETHNKKIRLIKAFNPLIKLIKNKTINKVFGNLIYDIRSDLPNYQVVSFKESVVRSESEKKVLIFTNHDLYIYKLRKELIEKLINDGYKVYLSCPYGDNIDKLVEMGCHYIKIRFNRHGLNPLKELLIINFYIRILRKIKPMVVLTYTIKPNIYGGIACRICGIPYLMNITGLGNAVENHSFITKLLLNLYRFSIKKAKCVFFQNLNNMQNFMDIAGNNSKLIPGSGVNLEQHCYEEYPKDDVNIRFLFIGRLTTDKGIYELIDAIIYIKNIYPNVSLDIIGFKEDDFRKDLDSLEKHDIKYYGQQNDVHFFIKNSHATVLPSYHEGMANVLLESAACGRPVIASKIHGCIETFDEGISGIGFEVKNTDSLIDAIKKFIELPYEDKKRMGIAGRKKMEKEFDRNIVVNAYIDEIKKIEAGNI